MAENDFAKALYNFTMDAAAGDGIRHLADLGYTPGRIKEALLYPAPLDYIGKIMYEHLLNNNVILLKDPHAETLPQQYEFVLERNEYGRTSYRKVKKTPESGGILSDAEFDANMYIPVEFGTYKYKYKEILCGHKSDFEGKEWDYLMNIPWPLGRFWHIKNELVLGIDRTLSYLP